MSAPQEPPVPDLREAVALCRTAYQRSPKGWYVILPSWVVHHGGLTFEQFAAKFDESAKRTHITLMGVVGFEVASEWNDQHVRRHRISWLDGGAPPPRQEENKPDE